MILNIIHFRSVIESFVELTNSFVSFIIIDGILSFITLILMLTHHLPYLWLWRNCIWVFVFFFTLFLRADSILELKLMLIWGGKWMRNEKLRSKFIYLMVNHIRHIWCVCSAAMSIWSYHLLLNYVVQNCIWTWWENPLVASDCRLKWKLKEESCSMCPLSLSWI